MTKRTIYHGSREIVSEIKDSGAFQGIFCATDSENASYLGAGERTYLHVVELDESEILTDYYLNYFCDYDKVREILDYELSGYELDDGEMDNAWTAIIEDRPADGWTEAETGWDAERIRGQVAKKLGYKAVEMSDEHGTSYLVLPGASIRVLNDDD